MRRPVPAFVLFVLGSCSLYTDPDPPATGLPITGGTLLTTRDGRFAVASDPGRDRLIVVDVNERALVRTVALQPGINRVLVQTLNSSDVEFARAERLAEALQAEIAGLAERMLDMSLSYANDRVQFGKPIGKLQAIQQQLAVMAEQVLMARMASQIGCSKGLHPPPEVAAVAKQVTSAAVPQITAIAHAVHGAIGITEEFDLQLYSRRMHALRLANGSESYWAGILGRARIAAANQSSVDFIRALRQL